LRAAIEAKAEESGRSLNAEMVRRLERSVEDETEHRLERSFDLPAFAEDVASQVVRKLKGTADG
jgi:ribose 5-phosphate isomerase RpiB